MGCARDSDPLGPRDFPRAYAMGGCRSEATTRLPSLGRSRPGSSPRPQRPGRLPTMHYERFKFRNFKGIDEMTLELSGDVTTLITASGPLLPAT